MNEYLDNLKGILHSYKVRFCKHLMECEQCFKSKDCEIKPSYQHVKSLIQEQEKKND